MINYSLDSSDESLFLKWLEALHAEDIVTILPDRQTFDLNNELRFDYTYKTYTKSGKAKIKDSNNQLIAVRKYTPDFIFKVNSKYQNFCLKQGKNIYETQPLTSLVANENNWIYVDVKGSYTRGFTSSATFGDRQVLMWEKYGMYINRVVCHNPKGSSCLFKNTFCPDEFIKSMIRVKGEDKGKTRIKYPIITFEEFKLKLIC